MWTTRWVTRGEFIHKHTTILGHLYKEDSAYCLGYVIEMHRMHVFYLWKDDASQVRILGLSQCVPKVSENCTFIPYALYMVQVACTYLATILLFFFFKCHQSLLSKKPAPKTGEENMHTFQRNKNMKSGDMQVYIALPKCSEDEHAQYSYDVWSKKTKNKKK